MAKKCRRTGKVNFRSEAEARRALALVGSSGSARRRYEQVEIAYYRCGHCPYRHLTSREQHGHI